MKKINYSKLVGERRPQKVRARLAKVVRYQYLRKGRTVLREGHFAETLYFILDGEITVTRRTYLPVCTIGYVVGMAI